MAEFGIVGIGSSAGGLEALQKLFGAMPADSGLGFVVAAHLDPTKESYLTELLGRATRMPVFQIEQSIAVEPDHVYVIAPDRELSIKEGVLHSDKPQAPRGQRHPVDSFFRSLAEDQGERAIAIILSGTGTNGSLGLRFIKAEGGVAIAQDPGTAAFPGMPRSAIGTGIVDLALPPERMPEALLGLARHAYLRRPANAVEAAAAPEDQPEAVLAILRAEGGRDFSGYKRGTLLRRIHRRMGLHRINGLPHYIERLHHDATEVKALVADLTINVTGFFRDPEAWEALAETVIAPLIRSRPTQSAIRAWVPGCSTGEEAYSIAMLVAEQAEAVGKSFDVHVFATDVAEGMLSSARAGQYPASISLDVVEQRLQRFFEQQDDGYCIRKSVRDTITFAPQNLLQDPPFSRLDLISCRNLLIYLKPDMHKHVLGLFHFALREGGHLFLGSAETISGQEELFQAVSKKWRIFRRIGPTRHDVVDFSLLGGSQSATGAEGQAERGVPVEPPVRSGELMMQALVDRYAPASVLIDAQHRVHYLRGPTGNYLQPASGEPSYDLLAMAREGLRMPLRTAVRKAIAENHEITTQARVRRNGTLQPVRLVVTPLKAAGGAPNRLLVSFLDSEPPANLLAKAEETPDESKLQSELDTAREELRLTIEQMNAANEELQASNEEIRSINEELQASNEELETSKEELQSLNEELNTVNNELQAKVGELEERTNDLNNLLNSTDIATLFLDRTLRIRWFTPAMKALFELMPTDIGRPISHFAQRFSGGDLAEDANTVLAKLSPMDTEVMSHQNHWYLRHMLPYRTGDDRIGGVVVSFTDITDRKRAEEQIKDAKEFAESIVGTVPTPLLVLTPGLTVQSANRSFYRRFQVAREETEGRPIFELGNGQWDIPELRRLLEDVLPRETHFDDFEVEHDFETIGRRTMLLNGRRLDNVNLVLLAIEDISERKRAEKALRTSEERLRNVLQTDAVGILFFDDSSTLIDANDVFLRMTGYARSQLESRELSRSMMTPAEWVEFSLQELEKLRSTGRVGPDEKEYLRKDGSRSWMLFAGASLGDGTVVEFCIDINDRKRVEAERELLAHELSHRIKNTLGIVQALAINTGRHASSVERYRQQFLGRLQAMARAHTLLLETNWRHADLKMLAGEAVDAYRADHPESVEVEGDSVHVTAKQGLGLSLILHELGTNAAKYGALSRPEGRLRISWRVETGDDQRRRLRLEWRERHGPRIEAPPAECGFGTNLIKQACMYELDGEAELHFEPEGLTCIIDFPVE